MSKKRKPMIFIAGPYRAPHPSGILGNIMQAREFAIGLWKLFGRKAVFLCPHLNTFLMDGECPDSVWLSACHEFLLRSDAVYLIPGWYDSSGSRAEVRLALKKGIPILSTVEEMQAFLRDGTRPTKASTLAVRTFSRERGKR